MSPQTILQSGTPHSDLVTLAEGDLCEIAGFIADQSGQSRETAEAHLRWFLLENPARRPEVPLGFGLRSAGELVGCILCVPQAFRFGSETILLIGSSSFYVDNSHRGHGGRIFLKYSRLAAHWPLFGTSANAEAAALWKAAGATPIPYSDGELFGVLHWPPLVEEFVHRRFSSRTLSRMAGSSVSNLTRIFRPLKIDDSESGTLRTLTSGEQVSDLAIHQPSTKLTSSRDLSYIRWRYFSGRDASVSTFAFRSRKPGQDILVTVNQRTRGYRGQINTLNVLDVYPEVPSEEWLRIIGSLIAHYANMVDAVVLRSQNPDQRKLFCRKGFQWRAFDAPTGWFLDKANLLPHHKWYPAPADGDGLI
jgi:hypothetical protein